MPKTHIITGIDIGNSVIKTIIAQYLPGSPRAQVMGVGVSPSNGLRKGVVIDMEEAIKDLKNSLSEAESSSGIKVKRAYVSISGPHLRSQVSRGVVAVSRADNEISENDIQRVIEAASTISLPPNREIVHIIPKRFVIDGQEFIKSPIGMTGIRLEADVIIIDALTPYLKSLAKVVNENDIEIEEFVFSPLAAAKAALDKRFKEHGVLCLDFGGGVCNLAVFEEGELIHVASLPVGSKHITNDLAIAVKTSLDNAEKIKLEHGFVAFQTGGKKENIDLSKLLEEENFVISKKVIGEVIGDRISEIAQLVADELKRINRFSLLPGGVILTGGGANLPGFAGYIKEKLKLPAKRISSYEFDGIVHKINDPSFAVAAGLILWGFEKEVKEGGGSRFSVAFSSPKFLGKVKSWFRIFLP